jgi:hypothetical protein
MEENVGVSFLGGQPPVRVTATNCATVNVEVNIIVTPYSRKTKEQIEKVDFKELYRDVVVTAY